MTPIPPFAPGCFGSALAFQADHPVCGTCQFLATCKPMHDENLARLRTELHISDKPKRVTSTKANEHKGAGELVLTEKVQALMTKIEQSGIKITEAFANGMNPFAKDKFFFLFVASHVLLKLAKANKSLNREVLAECYAKNLHCAENTANAYARVAFTIFRHVGAVDHMDGCIQLRKHQ